MDVTNTVVVGASAAGLAASACLSRVGNENIVLEKAGAVGATWRRHYDRLRLHTDKGHSGLPFYPFPSSYPRYPTRDQVVCYLEEYAEALGIEPRFGEGVISISRVGTRWVTTTARSRIETENVVVATGWSRVPDRPTWPGIEAFAGTIMHSSDYANGAAFSGRRALVVGFGNSGGEIAIDLCEHGVETCLAVRSPVNVVPKEIFGLPVLSASILSAKLPTGFADLLSAPIRRYYYGDIERYGLRKQSHGPLTQIRQRNRIPLIDIGTIELIRSGRIAVRPGIESFLSTQVRFLDGVEASFDLVVLATGFRPHVDEFMPDATGALDSTGKPVASGRETAPGLYFCGFHVSPTGMLREISIEAKRIARAIARKPA